MNKSCPVLPGFQKLSPQSLASTDLGLISSGTELEALVWLNDNVHNKLDNTDCNLVSTVVLLRYDITFAFDEPAPGLCC